jgi:HPt (histidine-containing phosphotransfer) domain-containing protein
MNPTSPDPDPIDPGEPPLTMAVLLRRCSDDAGFAVRLLRLFTRQLPLLAAAVERAVAEGDPRDITRAAHAFRGVASTMAAGELADVLKRIESATGPGVASDLMPALRVEVDRCVAFTPQAVRVLCRAA